MDPTKELDIEGNTYRIGKLDALTQLHVARKLAPVLATLGASVTALTTSAQDLPQEQWLLQAFRPVMDLASMMPEDDANYVIHTCLSVVSRRPAGDDGKFAPIQRNKALMFADIEMPTMFRLVVETVKENLGPFFGGVLGGLL